MYIFMYLIYILSAASFIGLALLGLGGLAGPHGYFGMNHPTFALLVSVIFLAAEVLVMFFFVGTGISIKEYVRDHPDAAPELHRRSIAIKRVLYPPTLYVTMMVMLTFILGGAVALVMGIRGRVTGYQIQAQNLSPEEEAIWRLEHWGAGHFVATLRSRIGGQAGLS